MVALKNRHWARAAGFLGVLALCALQAHAEQAQETKAGEASIAAEANARGRVTEATVTTAISEGEPTDYRSEIENSVSEVYFYSVLEGLKGQTVSHRWRYKGKVMAVAKFDVKNNRQKVWSSNKMVPEWTGMWIIEVVDGDGHIIDRGSFSYLEPI